MRLSYRALPLLCLSLTQLVQAADAPQRTAEDANALNVLTYFDGVWDVTIDNAKGKSEKKSSLLSGGYCVQQLGTLSDQDGKVNAEFLTVMTYDRAEKVYRVWQFLPGGATMEGTASWDDQTKTLTTKYPREDLTVTQDFSEPDKERWTWGKLGSGVNTRRK